MMKKFMTLAMAALMAISAMAQEKIVLRLMGDSTMADKDLSYENPERGWGQRLKSHVEMWVGSPGLVPASRGAFCTI